MRAPLEAVELQTGAFVQLWLLFTAERRGEKDGSWVGMTCEPSLHRDTPHSPSMSAAGAGRCSEGLDSGD